jgi:hypothetical protein
MEIMIARVLVVVVGLAVVVGAVLLVLSFFAPSLRFRRPKRPHDNLPFGGGGVP